MVLTKLRSEGQATTTKKRNRTQAFFGTLFIALSGCILYLDKAFDYIGYEQTINSDYYSFSALVWTMCQSISPILLVIGANLKPLRVSYVIPLYCYSLQIFYIFFDLRIAEKHYTPYYAFGTSILIGILIILLKLLFNYLRSLKNTEIDLLESIIESDATLLKENSRPLNEKINKA